MSRFGRVLAAAVVVIAIPATALEFVFDDALTNRADTLSWSYPEDGFVYGSTQGAYYLRKSGCAVVSPEFAFSITSLTVTVKSTSNRNLLAVPIAEGELMSADALELKPADADVRCRVSGGWPLALNVHQFALYSTTGSGSLYLFDCSVDGERVPEGLRVTAVYDNGFEVAWDPLPGAVGYELKVEQLVETPASWKELSGWSFAGYTNAGGSVVALDGYRFAAENPGLSGANLQLPAHQAGLVQIGSSGKLGRVMVLSVPTAAETVLFTASKPASADYGTDMPVYLVTGGISNSLGGVRLTAAPQSFALTLPLSSAGAALELPSTTNHLAAAKPYGSVNLYEVRLVRDYRPVSIAAVALPDSPLIGSSRCSKRVLTGTPGRFRWQVVAIDAAGRRTSAGEVWETVLSSSLPHYRRPGTVITIR